MAGLRVDMLENTENKKVAGARLPVMWRGVWVGGWVGGSMQRKRPPILFGERKGPPVYAMVKTRMLSGKKIQLVFA